MRLLFELAVWFLDREIRGIRREVLAQDQEDGLLSQLWQNAAFRNYVADRNGKLIMILSGGEGMKPEPREDYMIHSGQRIENLLIGSKAKLAYERVGASKKKS